MALAAAAYSNARRVAIERGLGQRPAMGAAVTAAVTTDRARRGENSCRIAIRTEAGFSLVDVVMGKASDNGNVLKSTRKRHPAHHVELVRSSVGHERDEW